MEELKIIEKLGEGAGGVVEKAVHLPSNTQIALKKIPYSLDDKANQLIFSEIKTLKECKDKYVVACYGVFQDDKKFYIPIEYMSEGSLY